MYFNVTVSTETIEVFEPKVGDGVSESVISYHGGRFSSSGGSSYNLMQANFATFQEDVNDRLFEQKRIGGVVGSMLEGLHQRMQEADSNF